VVRVAPVERLVESGEEATPVSCQGDEVGIADLAVAVHGGQLCVEVRNRVGPEFTPRMRSHSRQDRAGGVD